MIYCTSALGCIGGNVVNESREGGSRGFPEELLSLHDFRYYCDFIVRAESTSHLDIHTRRVFEIMNRTMRSWWVGWKTKDFPEWITDDLLQTVRTLLDDSWHEITSGRIDPCESREGIIRRKSF
jgi:hypothetical protein